LVALRCLGWTAPRSLRRAQKQVWQPKVIAKMWHYYLMKGQSKGSFG